MVFVPTSQYLALTRDQHVWIVEGLLPVGGFLNIYGKAKTGKSRLALQMAATIADPSRPVFLKWAVQTHGPVWYLQLDTPRNLFQTDYLQKFIDAGENLNAVAIADQEMEAIPFPFNIINPETRAVMQKAVREAVVRPVVVIIDTIRSAHNADENDSTVMSNVLSFITGAFRVEDKDHVYQPAFILLSHERKGGDVDMSVDLVSGNRGSGHLAARMDAIMRVTRSGIKVGGRSLPEHEVKMEMNEGTGMWSMDGKVARGAETDLRLLAVLREMGTATNGQWERACIKVGIPEGTFKRAIDRLRGDGRVAKSGDLYGIGTVVGSAILSRSLSDTDPA